MAWAQQLLAGCGAPDDDPDLASGLDGKRLLHAFESRCDCFEILHARHFNPVGGLAWLANAKLLPVRDLSAPVVNSRAPSSTTNQTGATSGRPSAAV